MCIQTVYQPLVLITGHHSGYAICWIDRFLLSRQLYGFPLGLEPDVDNRPTELSQLCIYPYMHVTVEPQTILLHEHDL